MKLNRLGDGLALLRESQVTSDRTIFVTETSDDLLHLLCRTGEHVRIRFCDGATPFDAPLSACGTYED